MIADRAQYSLNQNSDGIEIVIPARYRIGDVVMLAIWLALWTLGPFVALASLVRPHASSGGQVILGLVFVLFFLTTGYLALRKLLYWLFGRELITLSRTKLSIKRETLGFGRVNEFEVARTSRWHQSPRKFFVSDRDFPQRLDFIPGGAISFTYNRRTVRFGRNLNREDAALILDRIKPWRQEAA